MTEDFTSEALHYLLDDLDPARRTAFEERLARDPVAAAVFKDCADTFAQFALESAPAGSVSDAERRASLSAILAQMRRHETPRSKPRAVVIRPYRWLWPVAAALLLGLNLYQFLRVRGGRFGAEGTDSIAGRTDGSPAAGTFPRRPIGDAGPKGAADASRGVPATEVAAELARLDALQREYVALQRAKDTLDADYDKAIRNLAQRALNEKGIGRLTTMELVDANSYQRGERKGLMNLARKLLTEPGIVTATPSPTPPAPLQTNPMLGAPTPSPSNGSIAVASASVGDIASLNSVSTLGQPDRISFLDTYDPVLSSASIVPDSIRITPPSGATYFYNESPYVAPTAPASPPVSSTAEAPYAWSVYDDKENLGYLNLYNLPAVATGQSLQVWIKPIDSDAYRSVGEVPPQFYGRSGAVSYALPAGTATPSEVLITLEPRGSQIPKTPTGSVVLRGP